MSARSKWKNTKCVLCASSFPTSDAISVEDELSGSIGATLRGYLLLFNILPPDLVPKTAVSCPPCFDLVQTSAEIHRSFNESLSTIKSVIPPPVATRGNASGSGEFVERLTDFVSLPQRGHVAYDCYEDFVYYFFPVMGFVKGVVKRWKS
jgi:hypothetical protein